MNARYYPILILLLGGTLCIPTGNFAQQPQQDQNLQLKGYEVHFVRAKKPYQYRTEKNELKKAEAAYLVLLHFEKRPPVTNERIDFYIGDYKVPEYGGTKTGIYFRIFDQALLNRLNNQPISWKLPDQPKKTFPGKVFLADSKKMKQESEEAVLQKKY